MKQYLISPLLVDTSIEELLAVTLVTLYQFFLLTLVVFLKIRVS